MVKIILIFMTALTLILGIRFGYLVSRKVVYYDAMDCVKTAPIKDLVKCVYMIQNDHF
jgi:uncharacterized protein YneF (UPF0154 family)